MRIRLGLSITVMVLALFFSYSSAAQRQADKIRGVDLRAVVFFTVSLPAGSYSNPQQRRSFVRQAIERIEVLPGVEHAAAVHTLPFSQSYESRTISANIAATPNLTSHYNVITPDYFEVIRLPLLRGRAFLDEDKPGDRGVVILSDSVAVNLFHGEDPIGKRVFLSGASEQDTWMEVVGVVEDSRDSTGQLHGGVYVVYSQNPSTDINIAVRCVSQSKQIVQMVEKEIQALDSKAIVTQIKD